MRRCCKSAILACSLLVNAAEADFRIGEVVDFSLPQLKGESIALSDYRGEWVVINYWATWCAPCRKEIPELSSLHEERADVTVLGLAYEDIDDAAFESFLSAFTVTYPILRVDVYNPPQPFGAPVALPTTILLDAEGRAMKSFVGPVTRAAIEEFIDTHTARAAESSPR